MIARKFRIPMYDFMCHYIEVEGKNDADAVDKFLSGKGCEKKCREEISQNITKGVYDGGMTLYD